MSEITEVKAVLEAEDRASAVVKGLRAQVDKLAKSFASLSTLKVPNLKTTIAPAGADVVARSLARTEAAAMSAMRVRFAFQSRMTRQRAAEDLAAARERQRLDAVTLRDLRQRLGLESRMGRQRAAEERAQERERRAVEAATMSDFRRRMTFTTRMSRQQAREAREGERDRQRADAAAERGAAAALRRQVAGHRYLFGLRQRQERRELLERDRAHSGMASHGREAWGRSRDAVRDVVRPPGVAAIAGTAAAGAATRRILGAESRIDAAEIGTRAFGGLSADAARALRDNWAAPLAEQLGAQTDKLLTAWTDAVKLGIPAVGAKSFSELSTKTAEAWELPFEQVTDIFGTINTLLTSKGEVFDVKKLQSVANSIQHLAAKQSTTPERLVSFLQRGAGAAQVLGMSQEAGLAFGSASTSLGNQAGQSGRMFDYVASRLIEMPRLVKQHGQEGEQARKLVQALGYGSAEAMDRKRRADPDSFLPEFLSRFNKIRNPKQQDQAIRFFTGREWVGEFGRMVKGIDTYKEAVKLAKEAKGLDAIGAVWELHRMKLAFVFKQFRSGWLNILGEFGKVLSPMARQAGDVFLKWSDTLRAGGLAARFRASLEGFVNGLGFKDLPALLKGLFGEPGQGAAGAIESWRAAARGFGAGVRDVVDLVVGSLRRLSGSASDPEAMARWTARLLTFSAAMVIAGPAITALGGITSAIVALGTAAAATWTAIRVGALVSGPAAAGAGAGAAVALRAVVGRLLGGLGLTIAAELGARRGEIVAALVGAMRGLWADFVTNLKAELAEWGKDGILRGILRSLDPNLKIDPPRVDGRVKPEPDADVPGWQRALDWLRGTDRTKTSESGDPKPSLRPTPAPAWRDPPRKSEPAGINVLDAIKGALAPKVPTVELPDAGPTVVPTITVPAPAVRVPAVPSLTVPTPEVPALAVPRIPEAARPTVPPIAMARPQTVAATAPQILMPSHPENGNLDFGPIVRAISGLSALDVLRMIASTSAAILAELRRRSRRAVERQDGEGEIAPASLLRGDAVDAVDRLGRTMSAENARLQLAAFTAPSRAALAGFSGTDSTGTGGGFNAAGPGGPGDPAKTFGRNFFTPGSGSPRVPGWFGKGRGNNTMPDPGAGTGPYKPLLDHIARSEGTAGGKNGGYDVTLSNGALLPGGREQDLTRMTLDQVDAMQSGMLRHPGNRWNSSAAGRYQIVQKTLRGLRQRLGLRGDQLFDENMQDRLGAELVRQRGADPSGLGQEWASLRGQKLATAADLARQIPQGASTSPTGRPAQVASMDPSAGIPGAPGAGIPGLSRDGDGQYAGLRVKGAQATGGGATHVGVTDLARQAQADLPGGVKHFAAFNDRYHAGTRSKHASGLAFDTSLIDPSKSREAAEAMRAKLRAAGLAEDAFKVIDEYKNPSARSTAGHIHTQFNSAEAAKKYQDYIASLRPGASPVAQAAAAALSPSDQAMAAVAPPKNAAQALTPSDKAANAVDIAGSFEGMNEDRDHEKLSKFMGHEVRGDINAWCARFVNSSLNAAGIKNAGSPIASSYLKWGDEVKDKAKIAKGDVLVEDHRDDKSTPFKPGMTGGHAGLATGRTKMENGKLMLEAVSGNHDNSVKTDWYEADKVQARRAPGAALAPSAVAQGVVEGFKSTGWKPSGASATAAGPSAPAQAAVDGFTSTGWKPTAPAGATAPSADGVRAGLGPSAKATAGAARAMAPNASTLAREAAPSAQDLAKSVPAPEQRASAQGGGGAGGGGHTFSAPITIMAGNQSPQEMAGHLQRHITEGWNFRAHDLEPELT